MRYEFFISIKNLNLAWRRITTARNLQYKRFFRDIYLGYENGLEDNLKLLHQRLKGGWKASPPIREFIPKPSGFQRPISLLKIEDQIVYQAIANVFAKKLRHRRINVEGKVAFSNILESPKNPMFFLQDWRSSYQAFSKKIERYYKQELRWVAHFDLAAFYETISHELLIKMASPHGGQKETWLKIQKWLKEWSASIPSTPYHHGIPQGPIASDFLAECLLLPLDEEMLKDGISYLRYVDDIRIFGRSKLELRKIIIKIERWCKSFGLIPHGDKYSIKEAHSLSDAFGALPSAIPDRGEKEKFFLNVKEAERLFKTTLSGKPLEICDKSRAKYVLFRAGKSPKLLDWSLRLLSRHPEHINAFVSFFANYEKSTKLENGLMAIFNEGVPYDYVRGELWCVLARIGSHSCLKKMMPMAKNEIRKEGSGVLLQWGVMAFLFACKKIGLKGQSNFFLKLDTFIQTLLIPVLPEDFYRDNGLVGKLLKKGKDFLPGIVLGSEMIKRKKELRHYRLKNKDLCQQVQNCFRGLGIINRRQNVQIDQIGEIIATRYSTPYSNNWKKLLKGEYNHAFSILNEAENAFDSARSYWIQHQSSFNDIITRSLLMILQEKGVPGGMQTTNKHKDLISLGSLLGKDKEFSKIYSNIADPFRATLDRRNKVPGSHPYSTKGGSRNSYLRPQEQKRLQQELSSAYSAIIENMQINSIFHY